MPESLFSPSWHRVGALRPRLRTGVRVQRQKYRDETWYLLLDEATGKHHRINAPAYEFIGRFDGRASVNDLWNLLLVKFGDAAPGQEEIIRTLQRLAEGELLHFDGDTDIRALFRRKAKRSRRRRAWVNPLAFSLPLFDPARALAAFDPLGRYLLRPWVFAAWTLLVLGAGLAAAVDWDLLRAHAASRMATTHYLVLAWLAYPLVKLLHELAHALAVRHWGGEVHVLGVTFFCFVPAPYMDASAAGAFRRRSERALVSAIGIMVELALGAAALFVWLSVEQGVISDVSFVVMGLCGASSVLFNANPLLRFDGYYLLCDVLDTPNLAFRSRAYWLHLLRTLIAADASGAPPAGRGERKWLFLYAPLSWTYRLALAAALALWLAERSAPLGWLSAGLLALFLVTRPAYALLRELWHSLPADRRRNRAATICAGTVIALLAVVVALPLPNTIIVQGIVWPTEYARVRAESEGFISEILARDGQSVVRGTPLFRLTDNALLVQREALQARLRGLTARQYEAILREPAKARNVLEELERTRGELTRVEQRIEQWTVRSRAPGRLVLTHAEDLLGTFVQKGNTLAYVLVTAPTVVRAAVPQDDAALVRGHVQHIEVSLAAEPNPLPARLELEIPAATRSLPSIALGAPAGGVFAVDPKDKDGTLALDPFFLLDVRLEQRRIDRLGERAWIRFDLGCEPLAAQWKRRLQQVFLSHFNPET